MAITLTVNGVKTDFDGDPDTPLLWILREDLQLLSPKYGCGAGFCGACTVHIDGVAARSCVTPLGVLDGASILTLEGLGAADNLHPAQQAWLEHEVPQCGYCQAGQIMAAASFLAQNATPSDDQINDAMTNICRCGTYPAMRKAIHRAAEILNDKK